MLTLSKRHKLLIGIALIALLAATRGYHFATLKYWLPSASWAVFFLAGFYLRSAWMLAVLLGTAAALDYAAVTWGGVSNFCVSPAYVALLPAYGALWLAGHWYAGRYRFTPATLLPLSGSVLTSAAVCELISSGSFYFYSGRFTDPTFAEFAGRIAKYFPMYLGPMVFWVAVAALVHALFALRYRGLDEPTINLPAE